MALVARSDAFGPDEICFNLEERKNAESKELLIERGGGELFSKISFGISHSRAPASARVSYSARRSPLICS